MLLTEAGKTILAAGENILKELELVKQRIKILNDEESGEIRVTTECYTSYHWLSKFMKDFKSDYPEVVVRINADATFKTVTSLLNNEIDIGILEENTNSKLQYYPLFNDEFYALVSEDHDWAGRKTVRQENFADESYIMYNIPCEESTIYSMLFKERRPKELYKIGLTEAIVEMVKAGIGVTVLPNWVIKSYLPLGGMVAIPIRKAIKRTWYAAVLKSKVQPSYVQTFIESLSRTLKTSEEYALAEVV
jgi:LysR family transcriptional regulator for metE and metH